MSCLFYEGGGLRGFSCCSVAVEADRWRGRNTAASEGLPLFCGQGKKKKEKRRGEDAGVGLVGLIQADQADTVG